MTISIIKVGGWAHEDLLEASEMNDFQDELIKAIDGVDGGSYSPSGHLTFGGTGELRIDNVLRVRSGGELLTDAGSQSDFAGNVDFFLDVDFRETSTVSFIAGGLVTFHDGTRVVVEELDDLEVDNQTCSMRTHLEGSSEWNATEPYWECIGGSWRQMAASSGAKIYFPLPVMAGDDIDSMGVVFTGGSGSGHSALPAGMPRVRILEADSAGLFTTVVAELTDPTAVLATYDAAHGVTLDAASTGGDLPYTALDRNYCIEVRGEFGLDSEPDELLLQRIVSVIVRRRLVSRNVFGS